MSATFKKYIYALHLICIVIKQNGVGVAQSVVSGYRLDNQAIGVQSPAGVENFSSSLCVQTSFEAHPASYPMGTGGPFLGV
jgi:hypothetical protein